MATYDELLTIAAGPTGEALYGRIKVGCLVACDKIRNEATAVENHPNRLKWAAATLQNPEGAARRMLWAVLTQNRAATPGQITGASDAAVQTAVDAAVDLLAQG